MNYPVCQWMKDQYRDVHLSSLTSTLPQEIHFPLYVHLLNGFGYREEWAKPLVRFIQFDRQGGPCFGKSPQTPEAHRHKFLCALTLSEGSPGGWMVDHQSFTAKDFVPPILSSPLESWGDDSAFPEPSWTMQFLSAFLDDIGQWEGNKTPLAAVTQRCFVAYFNDFENGDLFIKGKTLFTESGLHLLEAINKLCKSQSKMIVEPATGSKMEKFFPLLKNHLLMRLNSSLQEIEALLVEKNRDEKWIKLAISNLLVSGHLLEVCRHPMGALVDSWNEEEKNWLENSLKTLASLMEVFFDPKILKLMDKEQLKAYRFPLFHAYRALKPMKI